MKIGFIGTGKMAQAIIKCLIISGKDPNDIIACDINETTRYQIKSLHKINIHCDNKEIVKLADVIFLCIKPQDMDTVLQDIGKQDSKLFISIAAGIKISKLQSTLYKVIRLMPNLGCLVSCSANAYSTGNNITNSEEDILKNIIEPTGIAFKVDENQMDIIVALSGSGPAYFAYLVDELAKISIDLGLDSEIAYSLAIQTMLGTAKNLKDTSPKDFINMVASPGGTTEAALNEFHNSKEIIKKTFDAAVQRSKELSK